ncbi:hypothetical protein NQ314_003804 [Rhamnusium bicolor]|uniref:Uncharacterized protein n=1 Tax=Rhamnusium bicolor TaxID=1586634 RepID=A0AAV8ZL73_9CUCU|nr:hypothetical protein NQ314_003804 [Rhamnusium bicolor]
MKDFNLQNAFKAEKMVLIFAGFYPSRYGKKNALLMLSAIVNISITLIQYSSMLIFIFSNLSDIIKISEVLLYFMTATSFICKLVNIILQNENLLKIEEMLQNSLFTKVSIEEEYILKHYIQNGRLSTNIFKVLTALAASFYVVFPLIDGDSNVKKFSLLSWYPFDQNNYYYEVFLFQAISIIIVAWFESFIEILFIIMMVLSRAQFEILKHRLTRIVKHTKENEEGEDDELVQKRLRRCIIHYNYVLRFVLHIYLLPTHYL